MSVEASAFSEWFRTERRRRMRDPWLIAAAAITHAIPGLLFFSRSGTLSAVEPVSELFVAQALMVAVWAVGLSGTSVIRLRENGESVGHTEHAGVILMPIVASAAALSLLMAMSWTPWWAVMLATSGRGDETVLLACSNIVLLGAVAVCGAAAGTLGTLVWRQPVRGLCTGYLLTGVALLPYTITEIVTYVIGGILDVDRLYFAGKLSAIPSLFGVFTSGEPRQMLSYCYSELLFLSFCAAVMMSVGAARIPRSLAAAETAKPNTDRVRVLAWLMVCVFAMTLGLVILRERAGYSRIYSFDALFRMWLLSTAFIVPATTVPQAVRQMKTNGMQGIFRERIAAIWPLAAAIAFSYGLVAAWVPWHSPLRAGSFVLGFVFIEAAVYVSVCFATILATLIRRSGPAFVISVALWLGVYFLSRDLFLPRNFFLRLW